ncbi:MAG: hypothetical protein LBU32_30200 [Clostridiales bacterium]|nr:hypothetical protein [Clostridiales bacterium]
MKSLPKRAQSKVVCMCADACRSAPDMLARIGKLRCLELESFDFSLAAAESKWMIRL